MARQWPIRLPGRGSGPSSQEKGRAAPPAPAHDDLAAKRRWKLRAWPLLVLLAVGLGLLVWQRFGARTELEGVARSNGRVEAVEVAVAAKAPGRVSQILVQEGEFVRAGQVVALMDTQALEAQLAQAEAEAQRAEDAVATARSRVAQRESEKAAAVATVAQRQAETGIARKRTKRALDLAASGAIAAQQADEARAEIESALAALSAARAQASAADAAIITAHTEIGSAQSALKAATAAAERVRTDIEDCTLRAPRDGRVEYLLAQPGEVIGAGGRVLNLVDLSDVYMTFFLPTELAGRVAMGTEVRLVLDAAPQYVIPARVSLVADVAQFTPKTVETQAEREKLMFRIRAQISPDLLRKRIQQVKTGLPGVAYVRRDPSAPWPERLRKNVVQ